MRRMKFFLFILHQYTCQVNASIDLLHHSAVYYSHGCLLSLALISFLFFVFVCLFVCFFFFLFSVFQIVVYIYMGTSLSTKIDNEDRSCRDIKWWERVAKQWLQVSVHWRGTCGFPGKQFKVHGLWRRCWTMDTWAYSSQAHYCWTQQRVTQFTVFCCRLDHISVPALIQFSYRLHWLLVPFLLLWKKTGERRIHAPLLWCVDNTLSFHPSHSSCSIG